jgi:hypothetical protein
MRLLPLRLEALQQSRPRRQLARADGATVAGASLG